MAVANNQKTSWVPDFVKEKRFHNWYTRARAHTHTHTHTSSKANKASKASKDQLVRQARKDQLGGVPDFVEGKRLRNSCSQPSLVVHHFTTLVLHILSTFLGR